MVSLIVLLFSSLSQFFDVDVDGLVVFVDVDVDVDVIVE